MDKRPRQQKPEYPVQLYGSASLRPFQKMAMSTSWGSAQVEDVDSAHPSSHTQWVGTLEVGECWVSQATQHSAAGTKTTPKSQWLNITEVCFSRRLHGYRSAPHGHSGIQAWGSTIL